MRTTYMRYRRRRSSKETILRSLVFDKKAAEQVRNALSNSNEEISIDEELKDLY
jgi:hypothetical protein